MYPQRHQFKQKERRLIRMKSVYSVFDRIIEMIENVLCAVPMGIILVVEIVQVFFRYVLRSGIPWSDEVIINLLVVCVMFGGAKAIRTAEHTELTGTSDSLPDGARKVVRVITTLATLAFLGVFVYSSFIFVGSAGKLKTTNLRIPMKYCYMVLAAGSCFMLYEFVKTIKYRITRPVIDVYDPENYRGEDDE